jgi:hypothetical protein
MTMQATTTAFLSKSVTIHPQNDKAGDKLKKTLQGTAPVILRWSDPRSDSEPWSIYDRWSQHNPYLIIVLLSRKKGEVKEILFCDSGSEPKM